jgi:hypothetical protein
MIDILLPVIFLVSVGQHIDTRGIDVEMADPPKIGKACLVGYATPTGVVSSKEISQYGTASDIYVIPERAKDARLISEYAGSLVSLCGKFDVDERCWSGKSVCAPYRYVIYIKNIDKVVTYYDG